MKNLHEIAGIENLEVITLTKGNNGYPEGLSYAITGAESFEKYEELAQKYDLKIIQTHKKDGWNLFKNAGIAFKPYVISSGDYGDNYSQFSSNITEEEFFEQEINSLLEEGFESFESIKELIKQKEKIFEEIENAEDDEIIITNEGNYFETVKEKTLFFYHDTHHYGIALADC